MNIFHKQSETTLCGRAAVTLCIHPKSATLRPERLHEGHREIEEHVYPALRMQDGCSGGLLLANPESGKMLAVTLWEDEQKMHATDEASHWFRVFGAEAFEGTVTDVEYYEVYQARLAHPEP